ncbi:MAG: M1 family aminopeptidase [Bacteroidota bacterium]
MYRFIFFLLLSLPILVKSETPHSSFDRSAYDLRSDTLDIIHTKINIDFGNYTSHIITAHTTLKCKSKINLLSQTTIDLRGLTIDSVKVNNIATSYIVLAQAVRINFGATFNINDSFNIDFYYHGTPFINPSDFGGFFWNATYAYNIGVSFIEDQHSYGRIWFPCLDNFVERSTYEYFITTDSTRKAFCGGNLINVFTNLDGSKTWHWLNNQNIPSYLASVTVARYATLSDTFNGQERVIPIQLGVLSSDSNRLKASFTNLKNAISIFEQKFGPYKFDRVGYAITDYTSGAMEHACNITYPSFAVNGTLAYETMMAHELSHHWWGDLITCENAGEMWLNEGWAVYSEHIFTEGMYGADAYKTDVRDNHAKVLQFAHVKDSGYYALSNVPSKFTYGNTSYLKGADIAHTLRGYMGDTMFFRVLHDYTSDMAFKNVRSIDFRDYISSHSSFNATNFFNDWVLSPGFPQFSIDYKDYNAGVLKLWLHQKLNHAPNLYNEVPIEISVFDDQFNRQVFRVYISGRCTYVPLNVSFQPTYVALDFDEKLSDATTDEYLIIKNIGLKNFNTAKLSIDTRVVGGDSILVRVEHHYVAPDAMKNKIPGLHLHNYRYWNVDGIFNDAITKMNAVFVFNGTNSTTNGFLDNDFITNSEDSLVLMYREDATHDWSIFDSTTLTTFGNVNDKNGRITAYNIKKGQYCFGIFDFRYEDTTYYMKDCNTASIMNHTNEEAYINVFPNPAQDILNISITKQLEDAHLEIYDMNGALIKSIIPNQDMHISIDTKSIHNGVYLIQYFNSVDRFISKFNLIK